MFLFLFSFCLLPDKILSEATTSKIKLKIEGNASSQLIKPDFGQEPSKVSVNGQEKDGCKKTCALEANKNNSVILEFDSPLNTWNYMFQSLTNIKEVDLSACIASQVVSMNICFKDVQG